MESCAKERKISKNYMAEIKEHCKNEDDTFNKNALHLANHFMKSGMSMTKKDNILGTIDFCKDKNCFSKQIKFVGEITHNNTYLDLYNGWGKKDKLNKVVNVFEL